MKNGMYWERLYDSFDGLLENCRGHECPLACCGRVPVLLFPEEKTLLEKIYGQDFLDSIEPADNGFYLLKQFDTVHPGHLNITEHNFGCL